MNEVTKVIDQFIVSAKGPGSTGESIIVPASNSVHIDKPINVEVEKVDNEKSESDLNSDANVNKDVDIKTDTDTDHTNIDDPDAEYIKSLDELNEYQKLLEVGKVDGYIPEDFDPKTVKDLKQFYELFPNKIKDKIENQYKEDFGEENVKLFMAFLNQEVITEQDALMARRIRDVAYLANIDINAEGQEAQKNIDLVLTNFYITNNIPKASIPALITDVRSRNEHIALAQEAQSKFNEMHKNLVNNYTENKTSKEKEELEKVNNAINTTTYLKDKDRDIVRKLFNEQTEIIEYKNHQGVIRTRKETKANVLLAEALENPEKLIAIISHLNNLNDKSKPDAKPAPVRKNVIFESLNRHRSDDDTDQKKSKYPFLDQLKQKQ